MPRIYYFPSGADELWFYFTNPDPNNPLYRASVWDDSWERNYFTADYLNCTAYWDNTDTSRGGGNFGTASAFDRIRDDGRKSVEMLGYLQVSPSNIARGNIIYFKVSTNVRKGTFMMTISM